MWRQAAAEKEAPIGVGIQISTEAASRVLVVDDSGNCQASERPFLHMRGLGLSLAFRGDFDGCSYNPCPRGRVHSREAGAAAGVASSSKSLVVSV